MDKEDILKIVANNLVTLMNERDISNATLSRRCQVSSGTISKIINGQMGITILMAMNLAKGLGVEVDDILRGLSNEQTKEPKPKFDKSDRLSLGVMSIDGKRVTCIKDTDGKIVGTSELEGGLDLAETTSSLMELIYESIYSAIGKTEKNRRCLKYSKLNLVMQSYEFEDTKTKFEFFAKKQFCDIIVIPDWQITYFTAFKDSNIGISLVINKGVSLSFKENKVLKKLGGWKFPVYDLGGENWLGIETIHHTIEAVEGYVPMTKLADNVLSKFNGKIEKITEVCVRGSNRDSDIYSLFAEILLKNYFTGDEMAKNIVTQGFELIYRYVNKADEVLGEQLKITISGSLMDIYKPFFDQNRIIAPTKNEDKASLLADISNEFLHDNGVGSLYLNESIEA